MRIGYRTSLVFLLGSAVWGTAMGMVWSHHQARQLFVELQSLEKDHARLAIQWERLQLERSTWAGHHRIEWIARKQLGMASPDKEILIMVDPDSDD